MARPFRRERPLQTAKLAGVVVTLGYAVGVYLGIVSSGSITSLIVVPLLGLGLVLAVVAESLLAGHRLVRDETTVGDRLSARPLYTAVRAVEALSVVLAVAFFGALVVWIPSGPMAGPGAIGVFFVVLGLGLLVVVGTLCRTLAEYYFYRRAST
ncbi:hypothetical protein ACFQHP_00815 [Halomicroarcula sp. GCM10025743]